MTAIWNRLKNEPAFVGALLIVALNGLTVFGVIDLTLEQNDWLDIVVTLLFGVGVRQLVYGPRTGAELEERVDLAEGELLDQP